MNSTNTHSHEFIKHLDLVRAAAPTITFKIRCYHKVAKEGDTKGHTRDAVTHEASQKLAIDRWEDGTSPVEYAIPQLDGRTMTLVAFRLSIVSGDSASEATLAGFRDSFFQRNTDNFHIL